MLYTFRNKVNEKEIGIPNLLDKSVKVLDIIPVTKANETVTSTIHPQQIPIDFKLHKSEESESDGGLVESEQCDKDLTATEFVFNVKRLCENSLKEDALLTENESPMREFGKKRFRSELMQAGLIGTSAAKDDHTVFSRLDFADANANSRNHAPQKDLEINFKGSGFIDKCACMPCIIV
eukprot:TRINITY_DN9665_c0_g6_i1.p1 TRINITY_DN9665_c0_g6~~TRINITY_DN9665_c0_g6_i1.p1  ORF type:complete len:179 (+),score=18.87 TRINITY_DN9665_c0_g6_i1:152-688(+)